ncbi:hypothetical protein [Melittangium boletus]|uniref:Uncharacterized protein n=1 Tax=Melittangium boletus DSM 14713 TaxID=1294270 RepID=A0A250IER5_9BACT|nr:hypothetical protein [Melittangium boletus]ATB29436.1 hypothetical protein MEBOL_002885 [Melittangium boletus DSM 14713]
MRVVLEAALLVSNQVKLHPLALHALFNLFFEKKCHTLEIDPPDAPEIDTWRAGLRESDWDEMELLLDESTQRQLRDPPVNVIRVADVPAVQWVGDVPRFPLQEAISLLHKPLRVLIEGVNDERFLQSAVPHFYRSRFEDWSSREFLKFEFRGGLPNLELTLGQELRVRERRLRLFAMIDSDARKRGEPSLKSRDVARTCGRAKVAHHQLKRRAIENYLPEPALEQWLKRKHAREFDTAWLPRLKAFRALSDEQRHHYNMRAGLKKDRDGTGLADIFETLVTHKPDDARHLEEGFGEVAESFHEDSIPEAWRIKDGQSDELMDLFEKMLRAA